MLNAVWERRFITAKSWIKTTSKQLSGKPKLAQQDYPVALYTLGRMLILGQGVAQNKEAGLHLIQKAIKLGFSILNSF